MAGNIVSVGGAALFYFVSGFFFVITPLSGVLNLLTAAVFMLIGFGVISGLAKTGTNTLEGPPHRESLYVTFAEADVASGAW